MRGTILSAYSMKKLILTVCAPTFRINYDVRKMSVYHTLIEKAKISECIRHRLINALSVCRCILQLWMNFVFVNFIGV